MRSIRSRLILLLVVTALLPLAVVFLVGLDVARNALRETAYSRLDDLADHVSSGVVLLLDGAGADVETLLANPIFRDADVSAEEKVEELHRLVALYSDLDDITLYTVDGYPTGTTDDHSVGARERTEWFRNAAWGRTWISSPQRRLGKKNLFMDIYLPIKKGGEVVGVAKAAISFDRVTRLIDRIHLDGHGYGVLIDGFGNVLAHPKRSRMLRKFDASLSGEEERSTGRGTYADDEGTRYAYCSKSFSFQDRDDREWTLAILQEEDFFLAAEYQLARGAILGSVVGLLVASLIGLGAAEAFGRPISGAAGTAVAIAGGDREARMLEGGATEMRALASSFNLMVDTVHRHEDELEELVAQRTRSLADSRNAQRDTAAQLRATNDAIREAILVVGEDGRVLEANRQFTEIFGISKRGIRQTAAGNLRRRLSALFEEKDEFSEFWDRHSQLGTPDGDAGWELARPERKFLSCYVTSVADGRGNPMARLWTFRDLTAQRELRRGLEQAQKMEAVGRLAGGVAHDFNNLLTGIIGNLCLSLDTGRIDRGSEEGGHLEVALRTAKRASQLVGQLLGFSRQSNLKLEAVLAEDVVGEVIDLVTATFDPRIEVVTALAEDAWRIDVDETQLGQVIMNLCVNARDAMLAGGTLSVACTNVTVGERESRLHEAEAGEFVCISVTDTGTGIPKEIQAKIFDPFFTTKEAGKGTGLGLSTSYGIVRQHRGWIELSSELGVGTTFRILLPRSEEKEAAASEGEAGVATGATRRTVEVVPSVFSPGDCDKSVLLVDDEMVVRAVAQAALSREGMDVVCAKDGLDALKLVEQRGNNIGLIVLDMNMPGLSGKEAFVEIRKMGVETPVFICSGYPVDLDEMEEETGFRPEGFVQKPYVLEEFASLAMESLNGEAA